MRVVVVRHLPTAWSLAGRLQGRADPPLAGPEEFTPEVAQAVREGVQRLAGLGPFVGVYCSRLRRTRETAEAFGYPVTSALAELDELDFGPFEGVTRELFLAQMKEVWRDAPERLVLGEPVAALEKRVRAFLALVEPLGGPVLAFGHGAWIRAMLALAETGEIASMNRREIALGGIAVADFWD